MISQGFAYPQESLRKYLVSYVWNSEEGCAEIDRLAEHLDHFDVEQLILDLSVHSGRSSCPSLDGSP